MGDEVPEDVRVFLSQYIDVAADRNVTTPPEGLTRPIHLDCDVVDNSKHILHDQSCRIAREPRMPEECSEVERAGEHVEH